MARPILDDKEYDRVREERRKKREAKEAQPIDRFEGGYRFLDTLYTAGVLFEGIRFNSPGAAYEAAKTTNIGERLEIASTPPVNVKEKGSKVTLRPGWAGLRTKIMEDVLKEKFSQPLFKSRLLATVPRPLVYGNSTHEVFWGVCDGKCDRGPHEPTGENRLGKLLEKIRKEIND